jgi:DNA-binding transcriptional ArsR family regulator
VSLPHPLPAEFAEPLAERFRLLSEPTRLRLLDLLRDGERSVGELAGDLGCTQANVSKHLAMLADGGLVSRRREGLRSYHAVADETVFNLCDSVCESLRRHLDARARAVR